MAAFGKVIPILTSLLLSWPSIAAFNLDVNPSTVKVLQSPGSSQGTQYFGYSVALHNGGSSNWVLVGAPLANVSNNLLNFGTVYKCAVTSSSACQEIEIDHDSVQTANAVLDSKLTEVDLEIKSGQWLGAVVHSTGDSGSRNKAVVCAPRYIWRGFPPFQERSLHYKWPLGRCFLLEGSLNGVKKTMEPCKGESYGTYGYGYCQAGMSAEYTDTENLVMGAVGIAEWKGGLAYYSHDYDTTVFSTQDQLARADYMGYAVVGGHFSKPSSLEFVGGAPRAENVKGKVQMYNVLYDSLSVSSSLPPPQNIGIGSYFGSALCAVDLNSDGYTDVLVGAPRFTESFDEGRVFIYINNRKGALNPSETVLKGDNVPRAQFGSAIAAIGDINKDGFQDVAIGAPYEKDGAGSGAVYIYHGTREGIESQYRQKILGSSVGQAGLQMFGQSISGNVDMDNNQFPDVAIGAYGSEKAIFLRSRRIIDVIGKVTLSESRIVLDSNSTSCQDKKGNSHKCLKVTITFEFFDPTRPGDTDLTLDYKLVLDRGVPENLRRMYFLNDKSERSFQVQGSYTIKLQNTPESLPELTVYIMEKEQIADVVSELTFDLTFSLNKTSSCVNNLCPVLNDYLKSEARAVAYFQKECKKDKCVLDLALEGKIEYQGGHTQLRIGLVKEMTVQLTVENKEVDTAYDAKVILNYPSFLGYIGVRSEERLVCEKSQGENGTGILTCTVGSPANPLGGQSKGSFGVKFSTRHVKNDFVIKVEASSGVVEDTNEKNNKIDDFQVKVKFETDLEMKGSSNPDQVVYSEEGAKDAKNMHQKDIGPEIIQTLQIRNNGPSPVDGSEVQISVPSFYGNVIGPENYLLYLLHVELTGPGTCNVTVNPENILKENATARPEKDNRRRKRREVESKTLDCRTTACKTFKCSLGLLQVGSTVEIEITARLWQSTLVKKKVGVVDLETDARVKVPETFSQPDVDNDQVTITTRANPAKSEVEGKSTPWWVILVAVLGGVLLLVIAIVVLYKFGFFRRKQYGKEISDPQTEEREPMNI